MIIILIPEECKNLRTSTSNFSTKMLHVFGLIFCLFCCCNAVFSATTSNDNITSSYFLKDPQTLISENNVFSLGFFTPGNSSNRYVGIWYNKPSSSSAMEVIWVANRGVPITDRKGQLQVSADAKSLILLNGQNKVIWSSDTLSKNVSTVKLLGSGNLVMFSISNETVWQSFDHPTDSVLPNMKLKATPATMRRVLQSWSSPSDPSIGRFSVGTDSLSSPQLVVWDGDRPYWRSGPWSGNIFIGIEYNKDFTNTGWRLSSEDQDSFSMMYSYPNSTFLSFYGLDYQGSLTQKLWDDNQRSWSVLWLGPESECFVYGKCGEFGYGTCLSRKSSICECLKGFVPSDKGGWRRGNWSQGCVRRTPLQCESDGFVRLKTVKVPDHAVVELGYVEDQCRETCLLDCSCFAYSYYSGIGCMLWNTSLIDIVQLSGGGAADLYLRLADSELGNSSKKVSIGIAAAGAAAVAVIAAVFVCIIWRGRTRRKAEKSKTLLEILDSSQGLDKFEELPLFKFGKLAAATNNFQECNKLGEGGFGPVYRGVLADGQEIAVKRLSGSSKQGVEEFMNEVLVISKLQHRNLVKILGCCVERQERMLVYEYMPNKSLDAFLFNPKKREILDWKKRWSIIDGISRGLLYLHRDSRLKIIHRDLKAGNILLDANLNPKISDFGMARIFGCDQRQADTRRVVGTYGYMPPEYAIEGRFSEKSDVFSFGVLLLEILTGKKTQWYEDESLSLLGYVSKLWNEDNVFPLIDPLISEQGFEAEVLKCLHVGLLCVQEYAEDRPDISAVISMLSAETTVNFRQPKSPGFTRLLRNNSTQKHHKGSITGLSITDISCR